MAFLSTLYIGDNRTGTYMQKFKLVSCHMCTSREFYAHLPRTYAHCKFIELSIVWSPGNDILMIHSWYVNGERCSGKLVFDLPDSNVDNLNPQRTIEFEEAECYSINESYEIDNHKRRIVTLRLSPQSIKAENITFNS